MAGQARRRSRYKLEIIRMINKGCSNAEIRETLQCSKPLPGQVRKWWDGLPEIEKACWLEPGNAGNEPQAAPEKEKPKTCFRTPGSISRGRYYISRY